MIKRICKMAFALSMSLGMVANYCVPAYAEEEPIEESEENEEVTVDDLKGRIESVEIKDREVTDNEVSVEITFNNDEGIGDSKLNVKNNTNSISIENPEIKNEENNVVYTFTQEFEEGTYTVSLLELECNDEEYNIDLSEDFDNLSFEVEKIIVEEASDEESKQEDKSEEFEKEESILVHNEGTVYGDDYPSDLKSKVIGYEWDPWLFAGRNCTSFVAWRLNNVNGVNFTNYYGGIKWGGASNWKSAATSLGISVNTTPTVGSVMWFSGETHVAWVAQVNGNEVVTEEYNYAGDGAYHSFTYDKISDGYYYRSDHSYKRVEFIHIKDLAPDTTPPTISNVQITNITKDGYDVSCDVSDNIGVTTVRFPTWTSTNDQDDLVWKDGTISGNHVTFHVYVSDHNNETNVSYITHIYAYDAANNQSFAEGGVIFVDATSPTISDAQITNITKDGYDVTCTVSDNIGVTMVKFPTWTTQNGQDDLGDWTGGNSYVGTISGNTASFHVNISDHNNEINCLYATHIYAYDAANNSSCYELDTVYVDKQSLATGFADDFYGIICNKASETTTSEGQLTGYVLTKETDNNANFYQLGGQEDRNQIMHFVKYSDGSYRISPIDDENLALDVYGALTTNGTNVQFYENNYSAAQKWNIYGDENGYYLSPLCATTTCLDLNSGIATNGQNAQIYNYNSGIGPLMSIQVLNKLSSNTNFYASLCSICSGTYLTSLDNGNISETDNGNVVTVQFSSKSSSKKQVWYFRYNEEYDAYYISPQNGEDYYLHTVGAGYTKGTQVGLYKKVEDSTKAQLWDIYEWNGHYYLKPQCSSWSFLDVSGMVSTDVLAQIHPFNFNQGFDITYPITSVSLNKTELYLTKGNSETLAAAITPSSTTDDQTITWTSSNTSVATVSNGNVTAIGAGSATITAATSSGISATCTVTVSNVSAKVEGYKLSLGGDIGVNFYMTLSNEVKNDSNAYMLFTLPDGTTSQVKVSEATTDQEHGNTYYVFPCYVSAKDMTSKIKAQLHLSDGTLVQEYSYTVKEYADYIINNESSYTTTVVNIAKTMLDYGNYTQGYFGYNTSNLPGTYNILSTADLSSYAYSLSDKNDSLDFVGARLVLTSKPGLKLYFKGIGTFQVDGKDVTTTTEGKYTVVTISDIDKMRTMYSITADNFELNYGIFSYGYVASKTSNTALKNLIYSMYAYDQALKG